MVFLAALALSLVVGTRPHRLRDRVSRPFVKTLPQKLRAQIPPVHAALAAALFGDRRDAALALELTGVRQPLALRARNY